MCEVLHAELIQSVTKANAKEALKLLRQKGKDGINLQDDACIHL